MGSTLRVSLDDGDYEHLVRGGSIRVGFSMPGIVVSAGPVGHVEFCLQDIGYDRMASHCLKASQDSASRLGKVKDVNQPLE